MSFCIEIGHMVSCIQFCCPVVEEVEYRPVNPVLQEPILQSPPNPTSPYQAPAQIEITPPLLPLP
uniref:Uncharacterized protein n=1 Tax=viral metagenome TaxID=1070528 RepID=A0A6C0KVI9_9ZZZZ